MQKEESGFFLGTQVSTAAGDRPAGMLRPAPHPPWLPPPSPLPVSAMLASSALTAPPACLLPQVDTTLFAEFQAWRESPTLDKTSPFLDRVYREDVGPCLDFTTQEVRQGRGRPAGGPSPAAGGLPLTAPPAALVCCSSRRWYGLPWRTTRSPSSPWLRKHCPQ